MTFVTYLVDSLAEKHLYEDLILTLDLTNRQNVSGSTFQIICLKCRRRDSGLTNTFYIESSTHPGHRT